MNKALLVEPNFPYPSKSKNQANGIHKNFVPIGLLKIGAYYKSLGYSVKLLRGNKTNGELEGFTPDIILITSVFTYWSKYVWDSAAFYRDLFPDAKIIIGGIYVTLHHKKKDFKNKLNQYKVEYHAGLHPEAEKLYPDYSLLENDVDHHVTHAMRGCIRNCPFCGTWKIEPVRSDKTSDELLKELKEINKNKVIFFDNNFLANKNVKKILQDISNLKINGKSLIFESQSGFDGRLLEEEPELAQLLRKARFQNIRIAWDNSFSDHMSIKKQIELLVSAGYTAKDISVFMIYNFAVGYEEMLQKLDYCKTLGVQIIDCRYRPLSSTEDNYMPQRFKKGQTSDDYYIHTKAGWSDSKIRNFRKRIREHNIWIRYAKDKGLAYDNRMEKWSAIHNTFKFFNMGRPPQLGDLENPTMQRRISMMNIIKNHYKKCNLPGLDFSKVSESLMDEYMNEVILQLELKMPKLPPV